MESSPGVARGHENALAIRVAGCVTANAWHVETCAVPHWLALRWRGKENHGKMSCGLELTVHSQLHE